MKKVKIRKYWKINPDTKIKENSKLYFRRKQKEEFQEIIKEENEDEDKAGPS